MFGRFSFNLLNKIDVVIKMKSRYVPIWLWSDVEDDERAFIQHIDFFFLLFLKVSALFHFTCRGKDLTHTHTVMKKIHLMLNENAFYIHLHCEHTANQPRERLLSAKCENVLSYRFIASYVCCAAYSFILKKNNNFSYLSLWFSCSEIYTIMSWLWPFYLSCIFSIVVAARSIMTCLKEYGRKKKFTNNQLLKCSN